MENLGWQEVSTGHGGGVVSASGRGGLGKIEEARADHMVRSTEGTTQWRNWASGGPKMNSDLTGEGMMSEAAPQRWEGRSRGLGITSPLNCCISSTMGKKVSRPHVTVRVGSKVTRCGGHFPGTGSNWRVTV